MEPTPSSGRETPWLESTRNGGTLRVIGFAELDATNAARFRDQTRAALTEEQDCLEVDLSRTEFVDSSGLGALIALYKTMCARNGTLRIVRPTEAVQQMLELTRMHRLFEISN